MNNDYSNPQHRDKRGPTVLVAVDFSYCSRLALRKAKSFVSRDGGRILALHVIDQDFIKSCIRQRLGIEAEIKKKLYLNAKTKLGDFLREEDLDREKTDMLICEGIPFIEINNKAIERDAEMIIMGSKGNSDDMKTIFFGSTTERVLRFIKRPVLCVPSEDNRLK